MTRSDRLVQLVIGLGVCACLGCGRDAARAILPVPDPCAPTGPFIVSLDYSPTWSQDAGMIAYVHLNDLSGVYVIDTLGTTPRRLLAGDMFGPTELSWSPGDSRIAMRYQGNIWTVNAADGALHQWTDKADVFPHWPGWSSDGRYLTFSIISKPAGAPESVWGVHVIDTVDGTEQSILYGGQAVLSGSRVAWSSNGGMIVSVPLTESVGGTPKVIHELFAVRADGSEYRRLTTIQGNARDPEWSADGSLLFFDLIPPPCQNVESRRETWVMNSDGSGIRKWSVNLGDPAVTRSFPFAINHVNGRCASVGRDSTGRNGVIVAMNLDGSGRRQITRPGASPLMVRDFYWP